jgi:hypothetical protein
MSTEIEKEDMFPEPALAEKSYKGSTISLVVAVLITILSFPLIFFTYSFLKVCFGRLAASGNAFYVEHWWDVFTLACALAGPVVILLVGISAHAALGTARLRRALISLPFALLIELCAMAAISNLPIWNLELAQNLNYLGALEHRLRSWDREHGRFPLTNIELDDAVGDIAKPSFYRQGRQPLDFQIEFVPNQSAPYQTTPKRPGVAYYAVDTSGNQFWLTASGLNAVYAERSTMAHTDPLTSSKQPWGNLLVFTDVSVSRKKM